MEGETGLKVAGPAGKAELIRRKEEGEGDHEWHALLTEDLL